MNWGAVVRILSALIPLSLLFAAPVKAEWREASSANFVVYADDDEKNIRRFSEQLELYHLAMEALTASDLAEPSPSNRLFVFVVKNEREVRRLMGEGSRYVSGYYLPRASGSIAVVPRVKAGSGETDFAMIVLLHEYAHHFLISTSTLAVPRWFNEGGAEFFASAEFPSPGVISLGRPAMHRAGELLYAKDVKARELLDPDAYKEGARKGFDSFYGRSWLLYHYLTFEKSRSGQMRTYLDLLAKGTGALEAAQQAFGDFEKLDRELDRYLGKRMYSFTFKPGEQAVGPIAVRRLDEAEGAVMPLVIRSRNGVNKEQAAELVAEVREVAARYPQSAAVQTALAEAEHDAGEMGRAIIAADRAIELDAGQRNAYVQKGYALFDEALDADGADAEEVDKAYKKAMAPFVALNRLENDHPLPLIYNYRSFAERGIAPPEQAVKGMERAIELAPFDQSLRLNLAAYYIGTGNFERARYHLRPIAFSPHANGLSERARRVVEQIDAGIEGDDASQQLMALLASRAGDDEEGDGGAGE